MEGILAEYAPASGPPSRAEGTDGAPAAAGFRLRAGVLLVSAALLLLEVTYTRLFSFAIWYHFAYATISLALLGFGLSGALVAAVPRLGDGDVTHRAGGFALAAGLATVAGLVLVGATPFDPFRLVAEPRQAVFMALDAVAVLVPFTLAGVTIAAILSAPRARFASLYAADLAGAGCGALVAPSVVSTIGAGRGIVASAVLMALAGVVLRGRGRIGPAVAVLTALVLPVAPALEPGPCASKTLGRVLSDPSAHRLYSHWNAVARIDVATWDNPNVSRQKGVWSIWGGSAAETRPTPPQYTVAQDADAFTVMYRFTGDFDELGFLDTHVLRLPYVVKSAPRVLVIGVGGGTDVLAALKYGARDVTALDVNPVTASLLTDRFASWVGDVFRNRPDVHVVVSEGRQFVRRTADRWDVVQVNGVDTLAAISSGAYVLAESYLYTREAIADLYGRLTDDGLLSVVIMDSLADDTPPRHMLRLTGVMMETLERLGVAAPETHLFVLGVPERPQVTRFYSAVVPTHRPIMTMEVMLKRSPFTADETDRLDALAADLGFVVWHAPGRATRPEVAAMVADADARHAFIAEAPLDLRPTTDDRPFFFSFYRWRDVLRHVALDPDRASATGQLVLLVMLVASAFAAVVVVAAPLVLSRRTTFRVAGWQAFVAYFACVGLGFMLLEVAFVQKLVLLLGYPTRAISVTLAGVLVFAGAGSALSSRLPGSPARAARRLAGGLAAVAALELLALPRVVDALLGTPAPVRIAAALVLLAPLGLLLGTFLPLGIRAVADRRFVPWAWAVNAVTSVVGTVLAVVLAMSYGFTTVIGVAVALYVVAALVLGTAPRPSASGP